jgi:rod shape-determining protein MreC
VTGISGDPGSAAQEATVRPYVTFTALDLVGVVLVGPRQDPRDSVLPPRPTGSPSPADTPPPRPTLTPSPSRSSTGSTPSGTP